MPARSSGTFASSNKLLQKKWEERQYRAHKAKMDAMRNKGQVDTRPPKQFPHLVLRLKQVQKEEERQAFIDHENQMLLHKMTDIMRKKGRVDNWNDYEARSLNKGKRERDQERIFMENMGIATRLEATKPTFDYDELGLRLRQQEKITMENMGIATRLEGIRPVYDTNEWEHEFQEKHEYFLDNWNKDTKEFSTSPRGHGKLHHSWDYEDDFEHDEEMGSQRLPQIPSRGSSQHNLSTKGSTVGKLPKLRTGKRVELPDRALELGNEAIVEQDCKLLFKATKMLVNPHEALNRALIRKSHSQRMSNKEKFKEMYDLDLEKELKEICSREHDTLIECLLSERESVDAEAINAAIYDNSMEDLVTLLCSRNGQALASIDRTYKTLFDATIEDDINDKIVDDSCQNFLKILLKPKRHTAEVDLSLADQDALDLYEGGDGRFTDKEGEFFKTLTLRSMPQIKAMFSNYRMVSGGESVVEAMEKGGCSKDYLSCVETLCNCMFGSGRYYASQIHDTMDPKNKDFVNLLLARSEIDMALIRRSYKREYGIELVDDLLQRCGETGALLAQIAAKGAAMHPPAKSHGPPAKTEPQGRRVNGMYIQGPNKRQPIRRPTHIDREIDPRSNPLGHKGVPTRGGKATGGATGGGAHHAPAQQAKPLGGTVHPAKNFNAESDAAKLHEAMKGWGTDEEPLIEVLAHRSNEQRQQIRKAYPKKYNGKDVIEALKSELTGDFEEMIVGLVMTPTEYDAYCLHDDVIEALKSELTGDFEELIVGLMMTPTEYDAYCLHDAMDGAGTRETALIGIICNRSNRELQAIQDKYKATYGKELVDAVKDDTSGDFKDLLKHLLRCERKEGDIVDKRLAESDAKELYKDGKFLLDVNDKAFRDVMTKRHRAQLRATFEMYKRLSGQSIESGLREAMLGDEEDAYVALAQAVSDPVSFYARQLIEAMRGMGTNDKALIRIVINRSEIDMADIKVRYREINRRTLEASIKDECSGSYKALLLALVKDNFQPPRTSETSLPPVKGARHSAVPPIAINSPTRRQRTQHRHISTSSASRAGSLPWRSQHDGQRRSQGPVGTSKSAGAAAGTTLGRGTTLGARRTTGPGTLCRGSAGGVSRHGRSRVPALPLKPWIGRQLSTLHSTRSSIHERIKITAKPERCRGTISRGQGADPAIDAQRMHEALYKWRKEPRLLLELLVSRDNAQRQLMRAAYRGLYNKHLLETMKAELGADMREIVCALVMGGEEYDAYCLHDALAGPATDDVILNAVLATRNPQQLANIQTKYREMYGSEIGQDVQDHVSGDYAALLLCLLRGERDQAREVDVYEARQDASTLHQMLEGKDCVLAGEFTNILTMRNIYQLREIFSQYLQVSGKTLDKDIKGGMTSEFEYEPALIALVKCLHSAPGFHAERLHVSLSGLGIDVQHIIRLIVTRAEIDLVQIKEAYARLYNRSLVRDLGDRCTGDYKQLLCAVVRGRVV